MLEFRIIKTIGNDEEVVAKFPINGDEDEVKEIAKKAGKEHFASMTEKAVVSCVKVDVDKPNRQIIYETWW